MKSLTQCDFHLSILSLSFASRPTLDDFSGAQCSKHRAYLFILDWLDGQHSLRLASSVTSVSVLHLHKPPGSASKPGRVLQYQAYVILGHSLKMATALAAVRVFRRMSRTDMAERFFYKLSGALGFRHFASHSSFPPFR